MKNAVGVKIIDKISIYWRSCLMWVYTCCLLLVSTYLYRYVLCFYFFFCSVVVCVGSAQHHPEGKETPRFSQPKPMTMDSKIYTRIKQHTHNTLSHTHYEHLLWAGSEQEEQVKWDPSWIPVTTSPLRYTMDGGAEYAHVIVCLFVCVCERERERVCASV